MGAVLVFNIMRNISDKELKKLLSLHKSGKEVIDLSGTDLSNRDLSGVYLEEANLENAFLAGCELAGADLRISNLAGSLSHKSCAKLAAS